MFKNKSQIVSNSDQIFVYSESSDKIEILPSMIQLIQEIKSLGNFKVVINLHSEVQAKINIKVISEQN